MPFVLTCTRDAAVPRFAAIDRLTLADGRCLMHCSYIVCGQVLLLLLLLLLHSSLHSLSSLAISSSGAYSPSASPHALQLCVAKSHRGLGVYKHMYP